MSTWLRSDGRWIYIYLFISTHVTKVVSISRARGDLYSLQINVIKLVSYVRQDTMFFLRLLLFHPYINLTNTIKLNVVSDDNYQKPIDWLIDWLANVKWEDFQIYLWREYSCSKESDLRWDHGKNLECIGGKYTMDTENVAWQRATNDQSDVL